MAKTDRRYEFRVRWKQHFTQDGVEVRWRYRYVYVQSSEAATRLADRKIAESDEDHCECAHDSFECEWCEGTAVPASDVTVVARYVGEWTDKIWSHDPS